MIVSYEKTKSSFGFIFVIVRVSLSKIATANNGNILG